MELITHFLTLCRIREIAILEEREKYFKIGVNFFLFFILNFFQFGRAGKGTRALRARGGCAPLFRGLRAILKVQ